MRKGIAFLFLSLTMTLFFVSCNEAPTSKIKQENLDLAKKRDTEIKKGGPKLSFNKTEHDFGTLNEGDIVETVFEFKNTGKSELIILSAKGSCGCTVPEWPKEPIMPGESGEVKVKFNTSGKPNKQQKQVTLTTNTDMGREVITVLAQVTPKAKIQSNS